MTPRVSIGMPVYNGERYLDEVLRSILAQDYTDFELIISNNASTDGTEAICREAARGDSRVRYYRNATNLGAAFNYNRVFELSSGRYFKWAAHDDLWEPTLLRRCVEVLDAAPDDVVLCYPKTIQIDETGAHIGSYDDRMDIRLRQPHRRLQYLLKNLQMCNAVFGLMRREELGSTRLIGRYVASDMVLLAELSLLGQFWEVPEELFLRRRHAGASCFANRTAPSLTEWFDPAKRGRSVVPMLRMFGEHMKAMGRAPLTTGERLRCYRVVMKHWLPKWRAIAGEIKRALLWRLNVVLIH
ncbi:MAG TPA: glycosyltransferase [Planctomycetota bacterium]|nr:glycosyltransferase [Planctomycetota bacterium]